jgi:hypothetical protein
MNELGQSDSGKSPGASARSGRCRVGHAHHGRSRSSSASNFIAAEKAKDPQAPRTRTDVYAVGPDFFTTFGIPFLEGEDFRFDGGPGAGTAIVNEAFARSAFPGQSPMGRRIVGDGKSLIIAGRVATAKSRTIGEDPRPAIYLPLLPAYAASEAPRGVTLAVKTSNRAATYTEPLRASSSSPSSRA